MAEINTLEDAFTHALCEMYDGEKQLVDALRKLADAASDEKLSQGFDDHAEETEDQAERIEEIADQLDIDLESITCKPIQAMVEDGENIIDDTEEGAVRDVMLIAGGQKVEHFEIATYGCLIEMAKQLGYRSAVKLLKETLEEEKSADERLNRIALSRVNEEALSYAA